MYHLTIHCADAVKAQEFYIDALRLPVVEKRFRDDVVLQQRVQEISLLLPEDHRLILMCGLPPAPWSVKQLAPFLTLQVQDMGAKAAHLARFDLIIDPADPRPIINDPDGREIRLVAIL